MPVRANGPLLPIRTRSSPLSPSLKLILILADTFGTEALSGRGQEEMIEASEATRQVDRNWSGRVAVVSALFELGLVAVWMDLAQHSPIHLVTALLTGWGGGEVVARLYAFLAPLIGLLLGMLVLLACAVALKAGPRAERVESVIALLFLCGVGAWVVAAGGMMPL